MSGASRERQLEARTRHTDRRRNAARRRPRSRRPRAGRRDRRGRLVNVPVDVVNVPGGGARKAWTSLSTITRAMPMSSASVRPISRPIIWSAPRSFEHSKYTPMATLVTEYIAFAVSADSPFKSGADFLTRLGREPSAVTVALSTALGNPNHIAVAKLVRAAGGDVNAPAIRVFDSALDASPTCRGQRDVCAVTAASVLAELAPAIFGCSAFRAPGGLPARLPRRRRGRNNRPIACRRLARRHRPSRDRAAQIAYWETVLRAATQQPSGGGADRLSWSPMFQDGAALRAISPRSGRNSSPSSASSGS